MLENLNTDRFISSQQNHHIIKVFFPFGNFGIQHYMFRAFMMLSLCMVMAQANQVDPSSNNVVQRINYGVIFREQSNMMLAQEYWLHTFHVPLHFS